MGAFGLGNVTKSFGATGNPPADAHIARRESNDVHESAGDARRGGGDR